METYRIENIARLRAIQWKLQTVQKMGKQKGSEALKLDFRFRDLLHNLLRSSDAFIHAGSNVMKTLWRSIPNGERQNEPFQLSFNASLKVDFQGSRVTSDGGIILVRELISGCVWRSHHRVPERRAARQEHL